MKKSLAILTLIMGSSSLSGCGAAATATAAATPTVLEGTWVNSACSTSKQKVTFAFVSSAFTRTAITYSDSACATPIATQTMTGTIAIGAAVTTPASSTAINFTIATESITTTGGGAATYNTYCTGGTVGTFVDGTALSVLGKRCGATTNATEPSAGAIGYNIFSLITTTTPNTFTLGGSYSSSTVPSSLLGAATAATIPTSLEANTVYTKQ